MAGKNKLEKGLRFYLDDHTGVPVDLSGDLIPGSSSGGGKVFDPVEFTGVSNSVKNYLAGFANAPVNARFYMNDSSGQSQHVLSRVVGKVGTLALLYGSSGSAPVSGDPIWSGEYTCLGANLITDGGRLVLEASFLPALGYTPGWFTSSLDNMISVLGATLIQALPMDDTSGTTARDASGNSRTGGYLGTFTLAQVGGPDFGMTKHVNLLGTGEIDGFTASLSAAFNSSAGMFACWVKPNDATYWNDATTYVLWSVGVSATYYVKAQVSGGFLSFTDRRNAAVVTVQIRPPTTARWLHVACTWDTASGEATVFINGTKCRPLTGLGTWVGVLTTGFVRYGDTAPSISNNPWFGRMCLQGMTNALPTDADIWDVARPVGQIVFDGDSRSNAKIWTTTAVETAFPGGELCYGGRGLASWAISGNGTAAMISGGADVDDLLRDTGLNTVVVWCGVNDSSIMTGAEIYANLRTYCLARRAAGWDRIIICSEIDAQGAVSASWHTTTYPALNVLLRAGYTSFADGLIDLGADSRLQDATNTTYYNVDQVHLTDAGYLVVAEIAAPVIARVAV